MMVNKNKLEYAVNCLSLVMIVVANYCFYTEDKIFLYALLTILGCAIAIIFNFKYFKLNISVDNYLIWTSLIYIIFISYGLFYLRAGIFSLNSLLIRLIENISMYLAISNLLKYKRVSIVSVFLIVGIVTVFVLLINEWSEILEGGLRIGDSLSGNVNTVGFHFGFISTLIAWEYSISKNKLSLLSLSIFIFFMILTGSKKTFIIIALDVILIFVNQKNKSSIRFFKLIIFFIIIVYLIFNVSYFYNILGIRIKSMVDTFLGIDSIYNNTYSYSTDIRKFMIKEAFEIFRNNPIFGGGYNNYFAHTVTHYEYSHCNYTEMLCSFGIFGTLIFYSKYINNLIFVMKKKLLVNKKYRNLALLILFLMMEMIIIDWMTVTFSGQSTGYLPIITSCAIINYIRNNKRMEKEYEKKKIDA